MTNIAALIFAATITFSPFAGIFAYIISFDEYQHHMDKKSARKQALQTAFFAFVIFVAAGLIAGFGFEQIASH